MVTFITVLHIITCILIIGVILIQSGRDGGMGSLGGSAQSVIGNSSGVNVVQKATVYLAVLLFITSIAMTTIQGRKKRSVFDSDLPQTTNQTTAPTTAIPGTPAAAPAEAPKAN